MMWRRLPMRKLLLVLVLAGSTALVALMPTNADAAWWRWNRWYSNYYVPGYYYSGYYSPSYYYTPGYTSYYYTPGYTSYYDPSYTSYYYTPGYTSWYSPGYVSYYYSPRYYRVWP
jgi:hypothetical protein